MNLDFHLHLISEISEEVSNLPFEKCLQIVSFSQMHSYFLNIGKVEHEDLHLIFIQNTDNIYITQLWWYIRYPLGGAPPSGYMYVHTYLLN